MCVFTADICISDTNPDGGIQTRMKQKDWARFEKRLDELAEKNFDLLRKLEIARACLFKIQTLRTGPILLSDPYRLNPRAEAALLAAQAYKDSKPN